MMNNEIYQNVAWNLINLRQGQWLTQEQLAAKIGLSKYQIKRVERGQGDTTLENINILAQYFEVPIESLFQKEKKVDVDTRLREITFEKTNTKVKVQSFSRPFMKSAKVKIIQLPFHTLKYFRIDEGFYYEIYQLSGRTTAKTAFDMHLLEQGQMLSAKGRGSLRLYNVHTETSTVLIFSY